MQAFNYIIFYKPYGVLSQFSPDEKWATLKDYGPFPKNVYPVGRLDVDSEGLILLTNDSSLQHMLQEPKYGHPRMYLVQVERIPTKEALRRLEIGVVIAGRKTKPSEVQLLPKEPTVAPRIPPIRFRRNVETAWLMMTLREGRNRQVRKMTATVGHPTLRLIRIQIAGLTLSGLKPGESRPLTVAEIANIKDALVR